MAPKRQINLANLLNEGAVIRPDELAAALKISPAAVYLMVTRGTLPHLKIGKSIRFLAEDVREFLAARRRAAVKCPGGGTARQGT